MALTFTRRQLSGATNGQPVMVQATSSPGTLIHTGGATATTGNFDSLYLWANMRATGATDVLTIEWGTTATNGQVVVPLTPGVVPLAVVNGWSLFATSETVRCFATAADLISIVGYVNRAT